MPNQYKRLFVLLLLSVLSQGIFCPEQKKVVLSNVQPTKLHLVLKDSLNLVEALEINWNFEDSEEFPVTSYSLYIAFPPDTIPIPIAKNIAPERHTMLFDLPDTNFQTLYAGLKAIHEAQTGQTWISSRIVWATFTVSRAVTDLKPREGAVETNVKTVFRIRSSNDFGEKYRFIAIQPKEEGLHTIDTIFPFTSDGGDYFPGSFLVDSMQLRFFGRDTIPVRWCILATQSPGINPIHLSQSITCSRFYKTK